jgi:hypothetical protein
MFFPQQKQEEGAKEEEVEVTDLAVGELSQS